MNINKGLFFIFLVAFLIRLIALNQSLWLDEATTARVVKEYELTRIVSEFSPNDFHPPLYYLFMKVWTNVFGYSEISLRFPSIIFSLFAGWFVYLIGGIWSVIFFLFNPLIVYYSQEARMYMMATFLLTAGLYYIILNIKNQRSKRQIKNKILFGLFISLAFLTFYGSIFLIAAMLIYLFSQKQYKTLLVSGLLFLVSFVLISPLLLGQFANSKIALSGVANWSATLGKANIKNLLLIPVKFSIGRISFEPKWLYYLVIAVWTTFIISQIAKLKSQIQNSNLKSILLYLFISPLFLGFIMSIFTPLLQYFRFIYLVPIMAILLAKNKMSVNQYILAAGFLVFSFAYLLFSQFHREDWRSLAKSLPKDKQVYMILSSSDPVKYYNPNLSIKELRMTDYELKDKNVVVIPYTADIHGVDYKKILLKNNYQLTEKKAFRGLYLEYWTNPILTKSVR